MDSSFVTIDSIDDWTHNRVKVPSKENSMLMGIRFMQGLVVCGILAGSCLAQRETPKFEGPGEAAQVLWRISRETDRVSKLALIEAFTTQYPKDPALGW